jgi:tRNA threonylcarbamoyladenosine biosynthesis protein TsaB
MLVLAVESATDAAGVAIADDDGVLVQATLSRGRRHAETIAPAVEFCCATASVALAEIDALVVDVGPGLFTGLRVGVGTAKAFAYALKRPLVTLSSLDILARAASVASGILFPSDPAPNYSASHESRVRIIPVLDARRGEVVSAEFTVRDAPGHELDRSGSDDLQSPDELATKLSGRAHAERVHPVLVGDGAIRYAPIFSTVPNVRFAPAWLASPPVAVLATMGVEAAVRGEFRDPLTVGPMYVRHADARINWEKRAPRQVAGI